MQQHSVFMYEINISLSADLFWFIPNKCLSAKNRGWDFTSNMHEAYIVYNPANILVPIESIISYGTTMIHLL